ncbi:hypothetical protein HD806DRAFT_305603 [Xylariaceae sp. AK1471]|nr:hypothetical protein HD806DRAFT_305603 [Xylariaceae sp. AK1471]
MGLLSFFSKKSYPDLARHESLKTSAYDVTVASSPPIRGTYPVAGNGSKILEQFQKSHPNLATIRHNTPAPTPLIPRLRNDDPLSSGMERPSTAPSGQVGRTRGTSAVQLQAKSALPPPPKKKYGPYKLPPRIATDIGPSLVPANPTPSPGLVSIYTSSIRSGDSNKAKGYVDLLDAQSMIKPADFYGRVQATGAKNYGEDVADRNKENISNPDTRKAQESHPNHTLVSTPLVSKDVDYDSDDERPRRPRVRHSIGSGLRSRYTSAHMPDSFPKRTSSRFPPHHADEISKSMTRTASARSERAVRRQSMPSYAPASSRTSRSSSAGRKGKGKEPDFFPDSLKDRARVATTHERESVKPNISNKRHSLVYPHAEHQSHHKRNDSEKTLPDLPTSTKEYSRRRTISYNYLATESRVPVKRKSLQGIRPSSRREAYEDTYQERPSLQGTQFPRDRNSSKRQLGSTTDLQDFFYDTPAQQSDHESQIIASAGKSTDNEGKSSHTRNQSIISLSNKSIKAHEIENSIPERTSSLRHWSLTSETAMSTLSSNPFRPQSGHTTNTSIDFTPRSPHARSNQSIPPVPDFPFAMPLQSMPRKTPATSSSNRSYTTAHMRQSSKFNVDDYATSDDDRSPSPPRGSYERDLLFSEAGYGISGCQLPGLPESFDVAVPAPSADLSASLDLQNNIHSIVSLLQMPDFVDYDSEDSFENRDKIDSSDEDLNFDIPMSRASSALRYNRTQERIPTIGQPIHEDDTDETDF